MSDVLVTFMYVPHCAGSNRLTPARVPGRARAVVRRVGPAPVPARP